MSDEQVPPGEEWDAEAAQPPVEWTRWWRCGKHGDHDSVMIVTTDIGKTKELETVYCMHCLREVLDAKIGRVVLV